MQGEQHQQKMERLPPGFRFFPTDEELITCYLARKAVDAGFTSAAISDVDLYSFDPWDLPCQELKAAAAAAGGGDRRHQECCYFFCTKGSKYSSCVRARRATRSGYWKSTGKDKAVYSSASGCLVGTKKTLVFYGGRAPKGQKTGWVMHEYALGESALLRGAQSEWVICRVLMKKDPPSDRKQETEETVHDQHHPSSGPGHLLPMEPGGCNGDQHVVPPAYSNHLADSHSSTHAMDGDERDRQHRQMAHDNELLMKNKSGGSSCISPPWPWLIHDDQLGTNCSALQFIQMQTDDADYSLPELLENDDGFDDLLKGSNEAQDIGGEMDRRAEMSAASVDHSIRLGGLYWNFCS